MVRTDVWTERPKFIQPSQSVGPIKYLEADKKLTDLTHKVAQISEKGYTFLLGRMHFTGDDGSQNFLVFAPILTSIIFDSNKKVTNWISSGISSKKIKLFETNLELTMFNLANGRVILKFNISVLVQKRFFALYGYFVLNLYIVYELNNWPRNSTNNFTLKIVYLVQSN